MFKICFSKEPTKCCHPSNIWGKYEDWVAISLPFIFLCTWNNFYLQVLNVTYLLCRWVLPHVTYYTFYFQLFHTFNFLINLKIRPFPMSSPDRLPKLHCKNFVCCLKQFFLCISVFTVRTVSIPDLSKMYLGKKKNSPLSHQYLNQKLFPAIEMPTLQTYPYYRLDINTFFVQGTSNRCSFSDKTSV